MKTRKSAIVVALAFLLAASVMIVLFPAKGQTTHEFTPATDFSIPETDGKIMFAYNGTYDFAVLENNAWTFVNLRLNYSGGGVNLTISAKDCVVNITLCRFTNFGLPSASIRYSASERGEQTIKFNHQMERAEWMVTYPGEYLVRGRDWHEESNGTIVVTGAPIRSNVTVSYRVFADYLGRSGDTANQSVFQQHSVAIATGIGLASILVLAVTVRTFIVQRHRKEEFESSSELA